jgi:hypothetical protein
MTIYIASLLINISILQAWVEALQGGDGEI